MNVAVIPARGGSKRIPRKNIREFAGKPMIAHSIECALQADVFERVIVSTDDEEIAQVARAFGAQVPFMRPADLADDHTGIAEVVAHSIGFLRSRGESPTAVCCLYATAPLMRVEDLVRGLTLLQASDLRFVLSATTFAASVFRSFRETPDGGLQMLFPQHYETRSQDLPETLYEAAQFCWGTPEAWMDGLSAYDERCAVVRIPRWRVQDIDTEEDWGRAEALARSLGSR